MFSYEAFFLFLLPQVTEPGQAGSPHGYRKPHGETTSQVDYQQTTTVGSFTFYFAFMRSTISCNPEMLFLYCKQEDIHVGSV